MLKNGFRAVCKGCEKVMEGQVQRLKLHMKKWESSRFKNAGDGSDDMQHPNTALSTSVFSIFVQDNSRSHASATKRTNTDTEIESKSTNNEPPLKKSLTKNSLQKKKFHCPLIINIQKCEMNGLLQMTKH